jgi:hypothetical protein
MKALTVLQPWAQLLALGVKQAETRSWSTAYRGPLAIHAGKRFRELHREFAHTMRGRGILPVTPLRYGEVLAIAQLVDCISSPDARRRFGELELELGDYRNNRFAWILADVELLEPGKRAKGALGLWEWEAA